MTGAERAAIAAEVGLRLFELQQRYGIATPVHKNVLRAMAIAQIADQRETDHAAVSSLFEAFSEDAAPPVRRGRPIAYMDSAAARADALAQVLLWAFKRLPKSLQPNVPQNRLASAVDALALAAVPADKSDLSRLRRGKRKPIPARAATTRTALVQSLPLLRRMQVDPDRPISQLTPRHKAIITPVRLRGAAFRLLRLAGALSQRRLLAEATVRKNAR